MLILADIQKLYDGTSATADALHEGVDLFVDEGRIHEIRPHDPDLALGEGHVRVDCSGMTVTPGIIDCHSHVTVLGLAPKDMDRMNGPQALIYVEKILNASLVDGGVTTLRDIGGATDYMKRLVDEGIVLGPRMKIAICMLSTTGGHADFRGPDRCHTELSRLWPGAPGRPSSVVDGPWECRKRVREIAACGADLIKICSSPGVASPRDKLEHRDFTAEEVRAICDEAEGRGLKVASHAHSHAGIDLAIENGVHDIQHISFMDEDQVERAARRGVTVTPTSWIVNDLPSDAGLSTAVMEKAKQVAEVHHRAVDFARRGDLKILAGTDPVLPNMHGRNYMEIVQLIRDGLSPLQAWYGATGLAAAEIGQHDAGTLLPGQRADVLLCRGDVIEQPERLDAGALVEVMKDGEGYRNGLAGIPQRAYRQSVADALAKAEPGA
ncbi:MAG: metal-dependent hydrolase family protein [Planctomycetota bacterium]|jgi:imidazolonepropionase-like amidohydrolase